MMRIVERKVSAGDREIFDLDEFLSRPGSRSLDHDEAAAQAGVGIDGLHRA